MAWEGWTELTTLPHLGDAEVLVSALIAAGIPARTDGDISRLSPGSRPFGIRVYVPPDRAREAGLFLRG